MRGSAEHSRGWEDQRVLDRVVASALVLMGVLETLLGPGTTVTYVQQLALVLAYAGSLAWRRRWPVPVLAVVMVAGPLLDDVDGQGGILSYVFAAMLAAWTVGRHLDRPATWWGPGLTVGFGWTLFALTGASLSDYVFIAILYGGSWAVGFVVRQREARIDELSREAEELRSAQEERAARAIAEERARIARELHDVVSHSISVITIQTQAVRRRLDPADERNVEDLRTVEATAREAMAEMRRLLGVLRAGRDHGLDLAPQPGLDQLPRLVADTVAAGVPVTMQVDGRPRPLPPGVDLAAYRVLQEALTNVRRHAGAAAAVVVVRYRGDCVEVQVDDDGQDAREGTGQPGHGLAGMTERVGLYGGSLEVGPRPGRGYRVRASLPVHEAALR